MVLRGSVPVDRTGQLLRRGGLSVGAVTPGSFSLSVTDARLKLPDHLIQRGPQGVIDRFGKEIRPRRDQMGADPEWRAGVMPVFDEDAGLVDLQILAQSFQALADQGGEGWRGLMMQMIEDEFHDVPILAAQPDFDKDTFSHLS